MPKQLKDFTDLRQHQWCIHCKRPKDDLLLNRDHVPSKSLVDKEYYHELQVTEICKKCNDSFSLDEEYFLAFLSAVLSGSTQPEVQIIVKAKEKFRGNPSLVKRISAQEKTYETQDGNVRSIWEPELNRIRNVVLKNARGHYYHECGEPLLDDPLQVFFSPLEFVEPKALEEAFSTGGVSGWAEVGSRWNRRIVNENIFDSDGFAVVQPDVYKFKIYTEHARVDTVIRNYLYTSVIW